MDYLRRSYRSARPQLRAKIIAWSFIPTAIILFLVALSLYFAYQQVTEELVLKRDEEVTRLTASEISASFEDYIDRLSLLARLPDIYQGDPTQQRQALLDSGNQAIFFDGGVYILNSLGHVVASQPESFRLLNQDWSDHSYFRSMVRSQTMVITNVEPIGPNGEDAIAIAVPVLGTRQELRGVVVGMFRLDAASMSPFYGTLIKLRIGHNGTAYLVDNNWRLIFTNDPNQVGQAFSGHPLASSDFTGRVGVTRTRLPDGRDIVAGYAPVPRTNWTLIVEEDWNSLIRNSQGYLRFLWLLLVFGLVFPTVVVMIGVRRITGPIGDFIAAAQHIADGDFSHPIRVETNDELQDLADQFNAMASHLKKSYDTLEERVAQRTEELTALNSVAAVVSRSLDLNRILTDGLTKAIEVLDMDAGAVFRIEPTTNELILVKQVGLNPEMATLIQHLDVKTSIIADVLSKRRPTARRVADYPPSPLREIMQKDGLITVVSIPLMAQETVLGAINVTSRSPIWPTAEALEVPAAIGQQIGVAMDNARLYNQSVEYARQMDAARHAAEEARAIAEAANAAKSDFLANVSHELRTPLASIFGFTRIVQKRLEERLVPQIEDADPKLQRTISQVEENLQIILDESQRLMTMINDLLDLEKIEAGRMEWNMHPMDVGAVIRQAGSATSALFEGKNLQLAVAVQAELPWINGDPDRIKQVAINLISNAVKFAPHGTVTVRAYQRDQEVIVDVIDEGIGIDPKDHDLVFEKFRQVGDTLTSKPKGTGLGLAISKEIITRHQGRIWFTSAPNQGSIFSFALPVWKSSADTNGSFGPGRAEPEIPADSQPVGG